MLIRLAPLNVAFAVIVMLTRLTFLVAHRVRMTTVWGVVGYSQGFRDGILSIVLQR